MLTGCYQQPVNIKRYTGWLYGGTQDGYRAIHRIVTKLYTWLLQSGIQSGYREVYRMVVRRYTGWL